MGLHNDIARRIGLHTSSLEAAEHSIIEIVVRPEHGGVAAEEDDGGPGEGQRAEGVAHPLRQRHHADEAIQPLLRRGYLPHLPAAAVSRRHLEPVLSSGAGDVRH
uniref:Uncharacterized protein n=1 Tax=Oryza meridionalis TaxID=40149 RepID=A0A0E0EFC4_9ORYZ